MSLLLELLPPAFPARGSSLSLLPAVFPQPGPCSHPVPLRLASPPCHFWAPWLGLEGVK